MERV
jgi:hypothetical protein